MPHLVKRPVAFRVPRVNSETGGATLGSVEWRLFNDEGQARQAADDLGCGYEGLYVDEWADIETAPKEPDATFLVCAVGDPRGAFVVRANILWQARKAGTPSHLGLSYLTHWMPLPALPRAPQ